MSAINPCRNTVGWLAVAILVSAYAVSIVDRLIVSLLVEPLKHDLKVTDTQIGLLQGIGFGIFYTILGLPLGWLADRVNRVRLIAAGIALWSVMTIACGLAPNFQVLFVARMGVGIGEAALVPAAISLLADLFEPDRRAFPMAVFTTGTSAGAGLSLVLGGAFIAFANKGATDLPIIGAWFAQLHPWQTTFVLAGSLGLPVLLLLLLLSEPVRRQSPSGEKAASADLLGHLHRHRRLFLPMYGGFTLLYILANSVSAWVPTFFIRGFGWQAADTGRIFGMPMTVFALSGTLVSGALAGWFTRKAKMDAPLRAAMIGAFILVPAAILAPLAPIAGMALGGTLVMYFALAMTFGVTTAAFAGVAPNRLRGQIVALYLLFGNLFGLGLGPFSVGFLLDHVFHDSHRVGAAMSIVALAAGLPGAALLCLSMSRYRAARAFISLD